MASPDIPHRFRIVAPEEGGRRRGGPGPAVLLVALYALLFLGGLFYLQSKSPLFRKKVSGPAAASAQSEASREKPPGPSRAALLEAAGLAPLSRAEYFRRLSSDCCPCGCDLNLRDCLLSDQTCVKSPELARTIFRLVS